MRKLSSLCEKIISASLAAAILVSPISCNYCSAGFWGTVKSTFTKKNNTEEFKNQKKASTKETNNETKKTNENIKIKPKETTKVEKKKTQEITTKNNKEQKASGNNNSNSINISISPNSHKPESKKTNRSEIISKAALVIIPLIFTFYSAHNKTPEEFAKFLDSLDLKTVIVEIKNIVGSTFKSVKSLSVICWEICKLIQKNYQTFASAFTTTLLFTLVAKSVNWIYKKLKS